MGKINDDVNVNDNLAPRCEQLMLALQKLMECKAPDGWYLVTRKVHWQAVYRVLVDEGWYDASLGYAAFVEYIRSVAPPGGFRIMPDVETIRHISQTLYARPFAKWRYDAAYHTKRWAYEQMRAVAEALLGACGSKTEFTITGHAADFEDGRKAYLVTFIDDDPVIDMLYKDMWAI